MPDGVDLLPRAQRWIARWRNFKKLFVFCRQPINPEMKTPHVLCMMSLLFSYGFTFSPVSFSGVPGASEDGWKAFCELEQEYVITESLLAVRKMSKGMKLRFLVMVDLWEGLAMQWWLAPLCCSIWTIRMRALSLPNPLSCPVPLWREEESALPAGSWRRRFCSDRRTFADKRWKVGLRLC